MQGTGLDLSKNAAFDMGYQGIAGGKDKIKLKTSGNVARVTRDIFRATGEGDQVATITWTVEPVRTRHKAVALAAAVGILAFGPAMAFAQQEQAQATTQVTVDLSDSTAATARNRWRRQATDDGSWQQAPQQQAQEPPARSAHQTQPETKHGQAALN